MVRKDKTLMIMGIISLIMISIFLVGCIDINSNYDNTRATVHRFMVNDPRTDNSTILKNLIERECNADAPVWGFNATRCKETLIAEAITNRRTEKESIKIQRDGINKLIEKHREVGNLSKTEQKQLDKLMEQPR